MAYNPPIGSIYHLYTTYILPSGGLYATYHLLPEPERSIELPCLPDGGLKAVFEGKLGGWMGSTGPKVAEVRSMKKAATLVGWLGFIGDVKLPSYIGIRINHEIRIPINQPVFHGK